MTGRGNGERHGVNREGHALAPLPSQEEILEVMAADGRWLRAEHVAMKLGVEGSRRLGVRASKGNWSGSMKGGVRLTHRMLAMWRKGLLDRRLDLTYGDTWEFRKRTGEFERRST